VLVGISLCITLIGIVAYVMRKPGDGLEPIVAGLVVLMGSCVGGLAIYEVAYHIRHRNEGGTE
jgi:hypothetical protein